MILKKAALYITDHCNLRCAYCYENNNADKSIEPELARRAIEYVLDNSGPTVALTFFGGEPLLYMNLLRDLMIFSREAASLREKEVSFLINTNGTLLDEAKLTTLGEQKVTIVLSLDGDRESHDFHRKTPSGGSSFELIEKNFPVLVKYPALHVRMTVTPETVSKLQSNVEFVKELGFKTVALALNRDSDRWDAAALDIFRSQYNALTDWYIKEINNGSPFRIVDIDLFVAKGSRKLKKGRPPCSAGDTSIAIGPDGTFYPCHRFVGYQDAAIGDITKGFDVAKALLFREYDPYSVKGCEECPLLTECYKCIWLSFVKNGDILTRVPAACEESKIFIEAARKVAKVCAPFTNQVREDGDKES